MNKLALAVVSVSILVAWAGCSPGGGEGNQASPDTTDCTPDCSDRECGSDGCGGSCGRCGSGMCNLNIGKCECVPPCTTPPVPVVQVPRIRGVDPFGALPGDAVTIKGVGFGQVRTSVKIRINTVQVPDAGILEVTDQAIRFVVPEGAVSGSLVVQAGTRSSNGVFFAITAMKVREPTPDKVLPDEAGRLTAVDQIVLILAPGAGKPVAEALAHSVGGELVGWIEPLNTYQVQVQTDTLSTLRSKIDQVRGQPGVVSAGPNAAASPEASDIAGLTGDPRVLLDQMNLVEAWDWIAQEIAAGKQFYYAGVAVSEAGVSFSHAEVHDYAANDPVGSVALTGTDDQVTHGTVVTSIVAGINGNGGMNGVLSGTPVQGFAVFVGQPSLFDLGVVGMLQAFVEKGLRTINMSFGNTRDDFTKSNGDPLDDNAHPVTIDLFNATKAMYDNFFDITLQSDPAVVFVASAGNGDTDARGHLPGGLTHPNLITVAAVDKGATRASFSNFGPSVDLAASGQDLMVPTLDGTPDDNGVLKGYHTKAGNGTSYAAPFVTGTIALLQAVNPNLSAARIKEILRETATPIQPDGVGMTSSGTTTTLPLTAVHPSVADGPSMAGCLLNVKAALVAARSEADKATMGEPVEAVVEEGKDVQVEVPITLGAQIFSLLDVLFMTDVSGSYEDDISTYKSQASAILTGLAGKASDVQFAVASFSDFPIGDYGKSTDHAFQVRQAMSSDATLIQAAIGALDQPLENGSDEQEAQLEALYQAATGAGRDLNGDGAFTELGEFAPQSVGWRVGALPVILFSTDALFHDSDVESGYPGAGFAKTLAALQSRRMTVVGLDTGGAGGDLDRVVTATGGQKHQLGADSAGIVDAIMAAMGQITSKVDITLKPVGDIYGMVKGIDPSEFKGVGPGEQRRFTVTLNGSVPHGSQPRTVVFSLEILGNDVAILQQIPVVITVP